MKSVKIRMQIIPTISLSTTLDASLSLSIADDWIRIPCMLPDVWENVQRVEIDQSTSRLHWCHLKSKSLQRDDLKLQLQQGQSLIEWTMPEREHNLCETFATIECNAVWRLRGMSSCDRTCSCARRHSTSDCEEKVLSAHQRESRWCQPLSPKLDRRCDQ